MFPSIIDIVIIGQRKAKNTAQKMKFSIKDLSNKCDQIHRKL